MLLENQVAIITGGARGIGKATVQEFVKEGAKVIIWDIDHIGGDTAQAFRNQGFDVIFMSVDTTQVDMVEEAVKKIISNYGRIDILINNAGILRDASLLKTTHERWQQVIDVNLTGVFNCIKSVVPQMVEQKYGRIVNASSIAGIYGNFGQSNYAAAKAGIIGLTKSLSRELGRNGITVNAIAPGYVETDMTATIPQEFQEKMIQSIPVKRSGKPEDIAYAYLFLASPKASFVNGSILLVDGGMIL